MINDHWTLIIPRVKPRGIPSVHSPCPHNELLLFRLRYHPGTPFHLIHSAQTSAASPAKFSRTPFVPCSRGGASARAQRVKMKSVSCWDWSPPRFTRRGSPRRSPL